jgi:hypothetical protein
VRKVLELADQRTRLVELGAALGASPKVQLERRRPKPDVAVQQLVDFFW